MRSRTEVRVSYSVGSARCTQNCVLFSHTEGGFSSSAMVVIMMLVSIHIRKILVCNKLGKLNRHACSILVIGGGICCTH